MNPNILIEVSKIDLCGLHVRLNPELPEQVVLPERLRLFDRLISIHKGCVEKVDELN